jgi:hypothetical protein
MVVKYTAAVGCNGTTAHGSASLHVAAAHAGFTAVMPPAVTTCPCTAAGNGGGGDKVSCCIHRPATVPPLTSTKQVTAIHAVASLVNVEPLQLGAANHDSPCVARWARQLHG